MKTVLVILCVPFDIRQVRSFHDSKVHYCSQSFANALVVGYLSTGGRR